jgi:hypothetical protein
LKANDRYRVVCISASALAVRMNEADNFIRCQACGSWIDCRDLGSVFDHEGPLPHPDRAHLESRGYFAQLTALPASRHCHTHDQQRPALSVAKWDFQWGPFFFVHYTFLRELSRLEFVGYDTPHASKTYRSRSVGASSLHRLCNDLANPGQADVAHVNHL